MQKAIRDRFIAENQPSKISQVFSTGISLEAISNFGGPNPYTAVQRLYDRAEKKEGKMAILEEELFNRKHSFHPTVYSERPSENIYLTTQGSEGMMGPESFREINEQE